MAAKASAPAMKTRPSSPDKPDVESVAELGPCRAGPPFSRDISSHPPAAHAATAAAKRRRML
jgi:hypothetical protein